MTTTLAALALAATLNLAPQTPAPPQETCREAYVEGWFLETAEADLEAALRAYRRCIELGAPGDRELVARAWWRMGMIARARDEAAVAEELLRRVVGEFAGTAAAARAAAALEAPAPAGPETEAVAQARADLRELLLTDDYQQTSIKRLNVVFAALSAGQIALESERLGASLAGLLEQRGSTLEAEHDAKLVELAARTDARTARAALRSISPYGSRPLPAGLLELARRDARELDGELLRLLAPRGEGEALDALEAVVDRSPELLRWTEEEHARGELYGALGQLLYNAHPTAGELLDRFLASVPDSAEVHEELSVDWLGRWALMLDTPSAERLRAFFPRLGARARDLLAAKAAEAKELPRATVDLLLDDPEPAVRRHALLWLARRDERAAGAEALERQQREAPALRAEVLATASLEVEPVHPLADLLAAADEGVLRELVYWVALEAAGRAQTATAQQGRGALDVVRAGVERGDPELLSAIFSPSDALRELQRREPMGALVWMALSQEAASAPAESLAMRLFRAALESPDERVRRGVVPAARSLVPAAELAELRERALGDASPLVRVDALGELHLKGISSERVRALLVDPDANVFQRALASRPEPEAMLGALAELRADRRAAVLTTARQRDLEGVVRGLFDLVRDDDPVGVAVGAFEYLKTRDASILLAGLTHPSSEIRLHAFSLIQQLDLPEELAGLARFNFPKEIEERTRELQRLLLAAQDEVAVALRRWNVAELERRLGEGSAPALAAELARLGARDELLARALDTNDAASRRAGGLGLVLLEDREALRRALEASSQPAGLFEFALELGLVEDCVELWREGRVASGDLLAALAAAGRTEGLARVLLGAEAAPEVYPQEPWLDQAVDAAAARGDEEALSRAAERFDSLAAARTLIELGAWERILADLPRWREGARSAVLVEVERRSGERVAWSDYASEQGEILAELRRKLGH